MNRLSYCLPLMLGVRQSMAQSQPATIPTVVAQAMAFEPSMFGRPQFFDGRAPTDWPAALMPASAKILGGGILGDSAMFRLRVAVFDFPTQANPRAVIAELVAKAGYVTPASELPVSGGGGFAETAATTATGRYCNGSTLAAFGAVDSAHAPTVFALTLLDGEGGRQSCSPRRNEAVAYRFPVTVPRLTPPSGVMSFGGGSSSSGSGGQMTSTLRTTMPTDSLLAHYSAQLVAAGWKGEGRAANVEGIGAQRFSFRDGQDAWTAALIVMAVGDRREILLQLSKGP